MNRRALLNSLSGSRLTAFVIALSLILPFACHMEWESEVDLAGRSYDEEVALPLYWPEPPMANVDNPYQAAQLVSLRQHAPEDHQGLHNVFGLSRNIISGSEPSGRAALERLARKGIQTIVTVDGKVPDAATARELGMRYIHIPIQYRGISDHQMLLLAKAFREQPAPFYVHCFHGRHRGPAAAAVGRIVRDGASRKQALAEMRQWCGTSSSYSGLFKAVATQAIPSPHRTEACKAELPEASPLRGFRELMIDAPRSFDRLASLMESNWKVNRKHPDINPLREAEILLDLYERGLTLDEIAERPESFKLHLEDSVKAARKLKDELKQLQAGDGEAASRAKKTFRVIERSCLDCHDTYRN